MNAGPTSSYGVGPFVFTDICRCMLCYSSPMKRYVSTSISATADLARKWVAFLSKKENSAIAPAVASVASTTPTTSGATVVGMSGELGSGKTAFVKEVARVLGITEDITSPTFVIEKIYQLPANMNPTSFSHLIHIDAYRIEDSKELLVLGWDKIISDPKNLILVEWPENIKEILPASTSYIKCEFVDENSRAYTLDLDAIE